MKRILSMLFATALCFFSIVVSADVADLPFGDINGDSMVDNLDANQLLQYDAGLIFMGYPEQALADVNCDGVCDNLDAARILKLDAGIIDSIGTTGYIYTEEKTNYALGKSYVREQETLDADVYQRSPYLGYEDGDLRWADAEFTKMTEGIVGDITDADYKGAYAAKPDVTVLLAGTSRLHVYFIDLGNYYGDISSVVFRNVRNSMPYGGNRGFKLRVAYVSDDGANWEKVTGTLTSAAVPNAPVITDNTGSGVEHFDYTYTLDEAAKGRYIKLAFVTDGGYVAQLEEIEVWNK